MNILLKKIIIRINQILNDYLYRLILLSLSLKKRSVLKHKKFLNKNKNSFRNFDNVLFVFQFFNNKRNCKKVLKTFLENKAQNILVFADGCIDGTANQLHNIMNGDNHIVIQSNDVHEIKNYRMSLDIATSLECDYVLLMQDDDIYRPSLFIWLKQAILIMQELNASIIGGKSGMSLCDDFNYKKTDNSISKALFKTFKDNKENDYYQLGNFEKAKIINIKKTINASSYAFAACVFRAPQLMNVSIAKELGFFPKELEPYQYDDYFNCFTSWRNNYKVILAPFLERFSSKGIIGGMRLYNNVNTSRRPEFFADKWNFIIDHFGKDMNNGSIQNSVDNENIKLNKLNDNKKVI